MDGNSEFLGKTFLERPIMLSPLPAEAPQMHFSQLSALPQGFQAQRNQSVGYNLQQEFEALKADLDLDLSFSNDTLAAGPAAPGSSEHGVGFQAGTARDLEHTAPLVLLSASAAANGSSTSPLDSAASPKLLSGTGNASRVLSGGPSLLAPAANSPYSMNGPSLSQNHLSGINSHPLLETLVRDSTLSPPAGGVGTTGLSSFLLKNSGFAALLGGLPSRPQLVNDFSMMPRSQPFSRVQHLGNFYTDMMAHTSWIETLNPQEIVAMLDYWCNNLPFDILLTMKLRLHNHLSLGISVPSAPRVFNKVDTYPQYQTDFVNDMENLSFNDLRADLALLQPKPKVNGFKSHLFADSKVPRPKLADPTLHTRAAQPLHPGERARLPTSHLYEKTNFLQLAAASHLPHQYGAGMHAPAGNDDGFDHSAAHKMGALATINSRVALDYNRKPFLSVSRGHSAAAYEELLHRQSNSLSVPANTQKYSVAAMGGQLKKKDLDMLLKPKMSAPLTPVNSSLMPPEIIDMDLLTNIPAWLKILRLHKYTDYLKDMRWQDLVELSDDDLEAKGVKALGARRKLLKAFEAVKLSQA